MKRYTIKPEFLTAWGEDCTEDTLITGEEVTRLADAWGTSWAELLAQLIPAEDTPAAVSVDNGHTYLEPAEAIAAVGFDAITAAMDESLLEAVHAEGPETPAEFLARYLELSPVDIVIG